MGELYQAMDLFVLPSLFEGLALVLVETQCAGLRILVSDAVTDEIKMTDRMEYLPLHDKKVWVNKILSMTEEIKEENLALRSRGRAVSYTHLDVYKRQAPVCSRSKFILPMKIPRATIIRRKSRLLRWRLPRRVSKRASQGSRNLLMRLAIHSA